MPRRSLTSIVHGCCRTSNCCSENPASHCKQLVQNTDAEREFADDRESHVGKLAKALDEAPKRGLTVISMKNPWNSVHPRLIHP
jgi:hypothetical protein